jgi:HK97 family phage major capsid protein
MNHFDNAAFAAGRAAIHRAIQRAQDAASLLDGDTAWLQLCGRVDPAKMIRDLRAEVLGGAEREVSQQLDRRQQRAEGNSAWLPWETLAFRSARHRMNQARADIVGTTTAGGYLVATMNFPNAAQALLSMLVLGRLGATSVDASGPNLNLPRVTTPSAPYWLSTEATQVTESDQTFGQQSFTPHTVGGYTELSHLLTLQSRPDAGDVVANDLARRIAREIERVAFVGSGAAGQPHGIIGSTGVNAISGTTFSLATACTAATSTGDALTDDASPGWVANRAVASLLRQRQEFAGSGLATIFKGPLTWGAIGDFPAAGTSGVSAATALFGNWAYFLLVNWAGGLDISVNPYANFQQGIIGLRALATLDVGTVWPGAFSAVTAIT